MRRFRHRPRPALVWLQSTERMFYALCAAERGNIRCITCVWKQVREGEIYDDVCAMRNALGNLNTTNCRKAFCSSAERTLPQCVDAVCVKGWIVGGRLSNIFQSDKSDRNIYGNAIFADVKRVIRSECLAVNGSVSFSGFFIYTFYAPTRPYITHGWYAQFI